MSDAILQAIRDLDSKLTSMDGKVDALAIQSAVIVERVGTLKGVVEGHLATDDQTHDGMKKRIDSLEHTRTSWKASMASIAAGVAFVVSLVLIGAKEAFAMLTRGG